MCRVFTKAALSFKQALKNVKKDIINLKGVRKELEEG